MFCTRIVILALLGHYIQGYDFDQINESDIWGRFITFTQKKCLKNADQNKCDEALENLNDFKKAHQDVTLNVFSNPKCSLYKADVVVVLKKFTEKLSYCLENEEKYLEQFIIEAYEKYSEYFCFYLRDLIPDLPTNTLKCITQHTSYQYSLNSCFNLLEILPHGVGDAKWSVPIISKQKLCEDLLEVSYCCDEVYTNNCGPKSALTKFHKGIVQNAFIPCRHVWDAMLLKYLKMQL